LPEPFCSTISRGLGEPVFATASRVRSWVLLQQQGPWGADALLESRLDPAFARVFSARAAAAGVRVLLIRRPGRGATALAPRCYVAHTGPRTRFLETRQVHEPDELFDLDLDRLRRGERPGFGAPVSEPLYLVCTNGRHDPCCAIRGRPLAAALAGAYGSRAWEASHFGGCRFAASVVAFPHGLYFGGAEAGDALRAAAAYEGGLLDLEHYRGRTAFDTVTQAAEYFVRQREGLRGVDDLVLVDREVLASDEVAVRFDAPSAVRYSARVRITAAPPPRRLTCKAMRGSMPPQYALLDLTTQRAA
jgi:hypothetical protein